MFPNSIRWRLQLWLAFLLVCVLSGFGVTVYQLHRVNQLNQIDEELERRVAALSAAVRGGPPPGRPPFEGRPGGPGFEPGGKRPPPPGGRPDSPPPGFGREPHPGPRELRLSAETASLFDETRTNGFYFAVWSRNGVFFKHSSNAPADALLPDRLPVDTRTHTRIREKHAIARPNCEIEPVGPRYIEQARCLG